MQSITAGADLQGLAVYVGVMGTFLTVVAWATYRDCQEEGRKKRAWAKAIVTPRRPFRR